MIDSLAAEVGALLQQDAATASALPRALEAVAEAFAAQTATLHLVAPDSDPERPDLLIAADRGLPPAVRAHVLRIPFGRGMAGICAERRAPVTVCNLQADASGVVRPGARETGVAGAIVVPLLDPASGRVLGTLGIGMAGEHDYSEAEQAALRQCAAVLADVLARRPRP